LNAKYHPDKNADNVWPHLVYVNAAYDFLKRRVWKRR
jgi:curved DNA-binding protein CbpA